MDTKELAYERDARGVCIICEASEARRRLGLCTKHYTRYKKTLAGLPVAEKAEFKQSLIDQGLLMPSRQGYRTATEEDEFAEAAKEFHAQKAATTMLDDAGQRFARPPQEQAKDSHAGTTKKRKKRAS